ncbi:MAG TPA: site-2 protease family protein [Pyrinomonadaceae bacterium]|nr:site-2 protease family protein [Pyrinomonadaceae bacterium]
MSDLNSFANQLFDRREAMRPTARTWAKHAALLWVAFVTVTIAGVLQPFGDIPIFPDADPQTNSEILQFLLSLPTLYAELISTTIHQLLTDFKTLSNGLKFSVSLLAILTAHESGHYVACRLYGVDATLPYFIPLPPLLGPAGTLGAFIKIVSPPPSRRATFDIGVAGPIAGFAVIIPVAVLGLLTMEQATPTQIAAAQAGLYFSDPLFLQLLGKILGVDSSLGFFNPFLAAAWLGLLVTSLNLIPSGQLDGGHAIYAVFGEKIHRLTGRIAFVVMATITVLGWFVYNSPSGLLFTILLAVMMRIRHPEPLDDAPLNFNRKLVAVLTLLIFILCFLPFPIQVR